GAEGSTGLEHPVRLQQRPAQVGCQLQAMASGDSVEAGRREVQLLDIHPLELDRQAPTGELPAGQLDHAVSEVDADHLASPFELAREPEGEGARTAGEIEDAHSRPRRDELQNALPTRGPVLPP